MSDKLAELKPVKLTQKPSALLINENISPTPFIAVDKSGKNEDIKLSIGDRIRDTKPIIKLNIPVNKAFIISPTPLFRHCQGF